MNVGELSPVLEIDPEGPRPDPPLRARSNDAPALSHPARLRRGRGGSLRAWGVLFLGLAVVSAAGWWVTNSPLFDLRTIHVSGNSHVTAGDIARLGGLDDHTNVIWFSPGPVERALERNPWIKVAHVSRTLPSTISVVVEERAAVAVAMPGAWLVAADGTILGPAGDQPHLPEVGVTGTLVPGSRLSLEKGELEALGSLPPNLLRLVATAATSQGGPLVLSLRSGVIVYYGDSTLAMAKAMALQAVLTWAERNGVHPLSIDVRAPGSPALVPGTTQGN